MPLLVDTSVWSLALRRDTAVDVPEVGMLRSALSAGQDVHSCGMVLLELLRGAVPEPARERISAAFDSLIWLEPSRTAYAAAAALATTCRRVGVQLTSIDALLAQLAIEHDLTLLTTDRDFEHAAEHIPLKVWTPAP